MLNSKLEIIGLTLICPILLLPTLVHTDYAQAADCATKACIDVYVQDGQLVIEAHKGSGSQARVARKPSPKVIPKKIVAPAKPKVTIRPTVPSHQYSPRKVVLRKSAPRKVVQKVASSLSLNDKLIKLLPTGNISHEPVANAIVNIPVIYWCDLPGVFSTKVAIIGEVVDVTMRPSFVWSFGDGSFYVTTSPGAAYPDQVITHTYNKAGTYVVVMVATWGGTWSNNGLARAITGEIRKVSVTTVPVADAPTRLTK